MKRRRNLWLFTLIVAASFLFFMPQTLTDARWFDSVTMPGTDVKIAGEIKPPTLADFTIDRSGPGGLYSWSGTVPGKGSVGIIGEWAVRETGFSPAGDEWRYPSFWYGITDPLVANLNASHYTQAIGNYNPEGNVNTGWFAEDGAVALLSTIRVTPPTEESDFQYSVAVEADAGSLPNNSFTVRDVSIRADECTGVSTEQAVSGPLTGQQGEKCFTVGYRLKANNNGNSPGPEVTLTPAQVEALTVKVSVVQTAGTPSAQATTVPINFYTAK